ncbi:MAG TPA: phytanoyl-CoA dioxygenase family protein, partial [Gemmatimonadales bacterium]|nr:phytanoyl-CoA dioxygenase family protein [Gemmatimonadales bacterium]
MNTVYVDPNFTDEQRRSELYAGQLIVYSPRPASLALCRLARDLALEAFAPHDPRDAQHYMKVEDFNAILAKVKPQFIHHPKAKEHIRALFSELGCDLEATYFDVPRLRTMAAGDYMRAGLAYQFHPHRDTWFSAPFAQVNWWMPVYDIQPENAMAFHPRYWSEPLRNSSDEYDYDRWNEDGRKMASQNIKTETRKQPKALDGIDPDPQVRIVCPVGGVVLFSAAQLHSTVDNTSGRTRFSIDFRVINQGDVVHGVGAPNIDSRCTGTTLGDYLRGSDFQTLPE